MYNKIKKQNGERFAKAIRAFDDGVFDVPDLDKIVKYAGRDAEPLMNYLVSLKDIKIEEHGVYQDPIDLLSKAGYDAFYVESLEQQNSIKKYYAPCEDICTFRDPNRFIYYHMIHCVKKDVDNIKRGNPPKRDDEYGTSVMSIQMLKTGGFISIKNRYNHTVKNPDNTLNSNPDNIIEGLSQALKHKFNVDFASNKVNLPENYMDVNGKIIKYYREEHNRYIGDGFYAKDGKVIEIDKNKEIMIENFVLNLQTKKIKNITDNDENSFAYALAEEIEGRKLQIKKNEKGNKCLIADGVEILEIKDSRIISLNFPNITEIGDDFLDHADKLINVSMESLKEMRKFCFTNVSSLINISMPNLEKMGSFCFEHIEKLTNLSMYSLKEMGDNCFLLVPSLVNILMPSLKKKGWNCFDEVQFLEHAKTPKEMIAENMRQAIIKNSYPKVVDLVKNQSLLNASQNTR